MYSVKSLGLDIFATPGYGRFLCEISKSLKSFDIVKLSNVES